MQIHFIYCSALAEIKRFQQGKATRDSAVDKVKEYFLRDVNPEASLKRFRKTSNKRYVAHILFVEIYEELLHGPRKNPISPDPNAMLPSADLPR